MNQDLTHRFFILTDRRQWPPLQFWTYCKEPFLKVRDLHYFDSILDLHYFFNAFSSDKNSLPKSQNSTKNSLKYLWYCLGSIFSKIKIKKKGIFGNPQSKEVHVAFFR